ncbi:hypothetical protein [Kordia sp.]|uniref:hypothetical protein n=1 Tax=Kordia sp. TaxID=1965332 RepID=UPI003D6A647B
MTSKILNTLNKIGDELSNLIEEIEKSENGSSVTNNDKESNSENINLVQLQEKIKMLNEQLTSHKNESTLRFNEYEKRTNDIANDVYYISEDIEKLIHGDKSESLLNETQTLKSQKTNHTADNNKSKPNRTSIDLTGKKVMYGSKPNSEGAFISSSMSETDKKGKYYKFFLTDEDNAYFEFLNFGDNVLNATDSPEKFIEPACNSLEELDQRAKKIITENHGIVNKKGELWFIIEKADIRYE